jgi:hypothetical protein
MLATNDSRDSDIDGWEVDGEADEALGGSAVDKGSGVG